jgi:hypothetical protein
MIRMQQPSLCLHSHDVPPPHYRMWRTLDLRENIQPTEVVALIVKANSDALAQKKPALRNIILNAHGYAGKVSIGGMGVKGIGKEDAAVFAPLQPLNVGTIWLLSCRAAEGSDGQSLCSTLARIAGTTVMASTATQAADAWEGFRIKSGPSGNIDDMDGDVYGFTAIGGIHRNIDPNEFVNIVLV